MPGQRTSNRSALARGSGTSIFAVAATGLLVWLWAAQGFYAGIPLERERALSAAFIETPEYGTRGTTALRVVANGEMVSVAVAERSDDNGSHRVVRPGDFERSFAFNVERAIA